MDSATSASSVVVGIYATGNGATPTTLLTQATISNPTKSAWNSVMVPAITITTGTTYWIAALAPNGSGTVHFRDQLSGDNASQASAQTNLTALPTTWTPGQTYTSSPLSAYGS